MTTKKPTKANATYSVFQNKSTDEPRKGAFGFVGQVLDGLGIIALSLVIAMLTFTAAARADEVGQMATMTDQYTGLIMTAVASVFAIMLAMLRKTWRHTNSQIVRAQRTPGNRTHRVG